MVECDSRLPGQTHQFIHRKTGAIETSTIAAKVSSQMRLVQSATKLGKQGLEY
jgi:hypothetical protein